MQIRFWPPSLQRWSATKRLVVYTAVLALVVGTFTTSLIFPRPVAAAARDQGVDIAPNATASASSENGGTGQLASKAIDGVVDGFPGDFTREWATNHGKAGSWLNLQWSSPQTANAFILYDRPNLNDQITGGNIQFDSGLTYSFGALNNDGTLNVLNLAVVPTFRSMRLNITSVSGSTINIGLAEIKIYLGSPPVVPNVLSLDQGAAATALNKAGLVVGTVTQDNTCKDVGGTVLIQNPTAGVYVEPGSAVNLRVSSGLDKNSLPCASFP